MVNKNLTLNIWNCRNLVVCLSKHLEVMSTKVTYSITMKTRFGNYRTFTQEFNNENHFNNWYKLMSRKGHKIVGVDDIVV